MFHPEPEGRYCCWLCAAKAPFWFSMEHRWIIDKALLDFTWRYCSILFILFIQDFFQQGSFIQVHPHRWTCFSRKPCIKIHIKTYCKVYIKNIWFMNHNQWIVVKCKGMGLYIFLNISILDINGNSCIHNFFLVIQLFSSPVFCLWILHQRWQINEVNYYKFFHCKCNFFFLFETFMYVLTLNRSKVCS